MAVRGAAVKGAIARDFERSAHLGYVVVFLAIIIVLGLGVYEALVALIDPRASVIGPALSHFMSSGGAVPLAGE